ncbi:hypothetical protein [Streptomyces sp. NPDC054863]
MTHEVKDVVVHLVVVLGGVEELAELCGGPDHDRARYDAGLAPLLHPGVRPQQRLGTGGRGQLDVLRRVEREDLLRDGPVERGAQRTADRLNGGRTRHLPERWHLGELGLFSGDPLPFGCDRPTSPGGLAPLDLLATHPVLERHRFGLVLDGVEQFGHVADTERGVDDELATVRLEVQTDVPRVPVACGRTQALPGVHELIEQLAEGDRLGKVALGPDAALDVLGLRDLDVLVRAYLHE